MKNLFFSITVLLLLVTGVSCKKEQQNLSSSDPKVANVATANMNAFSRIIHIHEKAWMSSTPVAGKPNCFRERWLHVEYDAEVFPDGSSRMLMETHTTYDEYILVGDCGKVVVMRVNLQATFNEDGLVTGVDEGECQDFDLTDELECDEYTFPETDYINAINEMHSQN